METARKDVINKLEKELGEKLIDSEKENTWCYYNVPIMTESEYYNIDNPEQIKECIKSKINKTRFIPLLKELATKI